MPDLSSLPSWLLALFTLAMGIGGFFALRHGSAKQAAEVEERVIGALQAEIGALRRKIDDLEKERSTQDRVIATIRYALKDHGLSIIIRGDFVTLKDNTGKSKTTQIQQPAQPKPIVAAQDDDTAN